MKITAEPIFETCCHFCDAVDFAFQAVLVTSDSIFNFKQSLFNKFDDFNVWVLSITVT